MKAIQSVVYAFSGINIFAKATASSMGKTAGSAKQASKSLAGVHNEINNVSENDNSGGNDSAMPNIDLSSIDNSMLSWVEKWKPILEEFFEPIKNSWDNYGQEMIGSAKNVLTSTLELTQAIGKSFAEVWLNGTGETTINLILQILISVLNTIFNINTAFKNAWESDNKGTEIVQNLWNAFNNLLAIIGGIQQAFEEWTASESFQVFADAIIGIIQTLSSWFEAITAKLREIWENGGKETFTSLLEFIGKVVEAVDVVLNALSPVVDFLIEVVGGAIGTIIKVIGDIIDALSGIVDFIIGVFTGDWDKAWQGISDFFSGIWNAIVDLVMGIVEQIWLHISTFLNNIKEAWNNSWNWIKELASNIWNAIVNTIMNFITNVKNTISNVLNAIKSIWNNVWTGLKTIVTSIFNGIWNTIKKVINSILGGIEGMANGVINGVNTIIRALNRLKFNIPDWIPIFGGKSFGFSITPLSTIALPRLAKGGIIDSPTVALMGEYAGARSNPEIATPQNIMKETFEDVLSSFSFNGGLQNIELSVYVGNEKLGKILLEDLRNIKRQTGKGIEALVS